MSKKWKIVIGIVVALLVIGAITTAALMVRSRMFSQRWTAWDAPEGLEQRAPFDRRSDPRGWMPFHRGIGPSRGMPFGRLFGPGRMWGMGHFGGPFAMFGGMLRLAGFGLVIWLAVSCRRVRRELHARIAADSAPSATGSELEA